MIWLDWHSFTRNLIDLGTGVPVVSILEKIVRPAAVYLLLVVLLKTFGKRMLAQLNPFDLVVLLTLSNTVQNAIIGNDTSLTGGIIGALSLVGVNALLVRIYYRGPDAVVQDVDTHLIRAHKVDKAVLSRLHINEGELLARAHERGFDDLDEVETAVLYSNGTIYMKGTSPEDGRLQAILSQLDGLRQDVAALRR